MKLYLDDIRSPCDEDTIIIRDPDLFLKVLYRFWDEVTEISLDHDLGEHPKSGYDVLCTLEEWIVGDGKEHKFKVYVHSQNPVGVGKMLVVADKLNMWNTHP